MTARLNSVRIFHADESRSKKFRGASSEVCWTSLNVRDTLKRREYTSVMIMNNRLWKGLDNPRTVWLDESEWKVILDCHEAMVSETEFGGGTEDIL